MAVDLAFWLVAAWAVAFALWPQARPSSEAVEAGLNGLSLAPAALLFLRAAQRTDLEPRLRRGLWLVGVAFAISVFEYMLVAVPTPPWVEGAHVPLHIASYCASLAGVLSLPQRPLSRTDRWRLGLDLGGITILVITLTVASVRLRLVVPSSPGIPDTMATDAIGQWLLLATLSALAIRGRPVPSWRALWMSIAAILTLMVAQVIEQVLKARDVAAPVSVEVMLLAISAMLILAGSHYCHDSRDRAHLVEPTDWMLAFNPLPALAAFSLAVLALLSLRWGAMEAAHACLAGLILMLLVLFGRTVLADAQLVSVLREEAATGQARQADRMLTIRRLAGGIAHDFNNLLTTVVAEAALGEDAARGVPEAQTSFVHIREAGTRAAELTARLLQYSGGQMEVRTPVEVGALVRDETLRAMQRLRPDVPVRVLIDPVPLVRADALQLRQLADIMAEHAEGVLAPGARLTLRITEERVASARPQAALPVSAGPHVSIAFVLEGATLAPDERPYLFAPYAPHESQGGMPRLGLAAAYGIVLAHLGGIEVQGEGGTDTTFTFYLPAADPTHS